MTDAEQDAAYDAEVAAAAAMTKGWHWTDVELALYRVTKERDAALARVGELTEALRLIVETSKFVDYGATSERVFSELDVYLDRAGDLIRAATGGASAASSRSDPTPTAQTDPPEPPSRPPPSRP